MKEEKMLRAIGGIDDDLIHSALVTQTKKHPTWVRWGAIAACLCLLLALPAGAAVVEKLQEFRNQDGLLTFFAPERYPSTSFSESAVNAAKAQSDTFCAYPMDSLSDGLEFLGLDRLENPVLEQAKPENTYSWHKNGEIRSSVCVVYLLADEEGILSGQISAGYTIEEARVSVNYSLTTERPVDGSGGTTILEEQYEKREDYSTPNGRACAIYTHKGWQDWATVDCVAYLVIDSCIIEVEVCHQSEEISMSVLKQILDAYS